MSPAMHRRSPMRRCSSNQSESPTRDRPSPRRRSSPHREKSPVRGRSSPRTRSPVKISSSHRLRSPTKEELPDRARSPRRVRSRSLVKGKHGRSPRRVRSRSPANEKMPDRTRSSRHRQSRSPTKKETHDLARSPRHLRSRSPIRIDASGSPSPRTKRLSWAQAEREAEKFPDREEGKGPAREHDMGRNRERGEDMDVSSERRLTRDKNDGGISRSSRCDRDRSISPGEHNHRSINNSRSPPRASKAGARDEVNKPKGAEQLRDGDPDSVSKMKAAEEALEAKQKQKPSFELSGKLAEETNRVRGVALLFTEPPDARKPDVRWRFYVFKAGEVLNEPLYVHRQSCYLFGRERRVADIPTDHPSCSKQHAVIQFRLVEKEQTDGLLSKQVRPYLMDLGSTNGTFINENRIEPQRYYELFEKDTVRFGNSSREYVILHENSVK